MRIRLLAITPNPEGVIEQAGRVCWRTEGREQVGTKESIASFVKGLIKRGHESVLEHASATFEIEGVSRSLTHQLVRHRIASFSQESQRYVPQEGFEYITPPSIAKTDVAKAAYDLIMSKIQSAYSELVELGVPAEDARMVLPNATHSKIVVTMNMREFRNTLRLRCEKHAQWEIRFLFAGILGMLKMKCPNVFHDMEVDENGCLKD